MLDLGNKNFRFPEYYKDFVLEKGEANQIVVSDVESFHAGATRPIFVSRDLQECIDFIDGDYLNRMPTILKIFWKLKSLRHAKQRRKLLASDPTIVLPKTIEFGGWLKPFADSKVGTHPVFNFAKFPPKGFQFRSSDNIYLSLNHLLNGFSIARAICTYSYRFWRRGVPATFILQFWLTRGINRQNLKIQPNGPIVLYPTYLFICPNHSWFVEIEDMLTLMAPFVSNGSLNPSLCHDHPIVKVMEVLFESDTCKGVVCHLKATAEGLKLIYKDNPCVVKKIRYIALGMPLPPKIQRPARTDLKPIKILYINGWAQDKRASFRRGLLDALKTFAIVAAEFENVSLTVRSQLPELTPEYMKILGDPRVTILPDKIHQGKLQELYRESDILLYPAVRIAVTSLLQAMANSLAIVASDGFGIEEYVEDEVNGLIGRGFNGKTGWIDEKGFFRENYLLSLKSNSEVVENCAKQIRRLILDQNLLVRLQNNARLTLEQRFTTEKWNEEFGPYLTEITT